MTANDLQGALVLLAQAKLLLYRYVNRAKEISDPRARQLMDAGRKVQQLIEEIERS